MPCRMDESLAKSDNLQQSPTQQHNTETPDYSLDCEMSKRQNLYTYDKSDFKKDWFICFHLPKISLITLRRSWNLRLLFLIAMTSLTVVCFYSGIFPSLSSRRHIESIQIPRVAIEIKRADRSQELPGGKEEQPEGGEDSTNHVPKGEKRFPSCIIFGVSKGGTRAMLEYLKLHPHVVAPMAEINFFNNETLFHRGAKWYLDQMPYARDNQIIVEKSPDYFQTPECAPMIRRMNSTIKLLLLLRNPVERLVSQYMQLLDKNPSLPSFEEWVIHPATKDINTNIRSVMVSAYAKYLEPWLSVFSDNQLLIVESDNLRQDPLSEMKRVEKFLNLEPYFESSDFYFNTTRGFYCLRYRSTGKSKCLGKSKGRQHIAVNEAVLKLLRKFYEPYNKRLNEMLGTRFPWS